MPPRPSGEGSTSTSPPRLSAAEIYGQGLAAAAAGDGTAAPWPPPGWYLQGADGRRMPLPLRRWCGAVDGADHTVLRRCAPPTMDVGCGPGRLTAALVRGGLDALGIDLSPVAVRLARAAGAPALRRCVFRRLPREGGWATVLLIDGNIGIGGDPPALLQRCAELLRSGGQVLVELDRPGSASRSCRLRVQSPDAVSEWFDWAQLSGDDVDEATAAAGMDVAERWEQAGRWFATLVKP